MRRDHTGATGLLVGAWACVCTVGIAGSSEAQEPEDMSGAPAHRVETRADGGAIIGSVSSDGRLFVFADWAGSVPGDVSVQDLETGAYRRLTHYGGYNVLNPVISPDSRQIAFALRNAKRVYDLHLMDVDGTDDHVLHADEQVHIFPADWSPDGSQILVALTRRDGTNQIAVIDVTDGSLGVVRSLDSRLPGRLRFSPDGRFVAYDLPTRPDATARDIFLLRLSTGQEVPLVEGPPHEIVVGWGLDGRRLLFGRRREGTMDVWALPLADGNPAGAPTVVREDVGQVGPLGFTKEGAFFYVRGRGTRHVHVLEIDPATRRLIRPPEQVATESDHPTFGPAWSPDGESLAYFSTRGPYDAGPDVRAIVIRSRGTGEERVLAPKLDFPEDHPHELRWSPDGRSLLMVADDSRGRWSFCVVSLETGEATVLVPGRPGELLTSPAWSPDGKVLFYVHHRPSVQLSRIIARELVSGRVTELYRAPLSELPFRSGRDEAMVLSADGQQIAFALAASPPQSSALMLLPAGGGEPRELLRGQDLHVQGWTPDGRVLFTGRPDATEQGWLWSVSPIAGAAPEALLGPFNLQGYPRPSPFGTSVHPNGREIAFTTGPIVRGEVWVIPNLRPLTRSGR